MERNLLLTIEYDGTNFSGWQRQKKARTVQGEIEKKLSIICKQPITLNGTSRTDAGVHALAQKATFNGEFGIPTDRIKEVLNNLLSGGLETHGKYSDIKITKVEEMPPRFHARFDSKGKKYKYIIDNSGERDTFRRNYCYLIKPPLDVVAMKDAARYIEGTHDFSCFQSPGGTPREITERTIYYVDVYRNDDDVIIEIEGNGFLYNMVRIITGTLIEVGLGKRDPMDTASIIESKDRQRAGHTAPAQGLYLVDIFFESKEERDGKENG